MRASVNFDLAAKSVRIIVGLHQPNLALLHILLAYHAEAFCEKPFKNHVNGSASIAYSSRCL